ncbi:hypothetical protein Emed_006469 [Eimeria media]
MEEALGPPGLLGALEDTADVQKAKNLLTTADLIAADAGASASLISRWGPLLLSRVREGGAPLGGPLTGAPQVPRICQLEGFKELQRRQRRRQLRKPQQQHKQQQQQQQQQQHKQQQQQQEEDEEKEDLGVPEAETAVVFVSFFLDKALPSLEALVDMMPGLRTLTLCCFFSEDQQRWHARCMQQQQQSASLQRVAAILRQRRGEGGPHQSRSEAPGGPLPLSVEILHTPLHASPFSANSFLLTDGSAAPLITEDSARRLLAEAAAEERLLQRRPAAAGESQAETHEEAYSALASRLAECCYWWGCTSSAVHCSGAAARLLGRAVAERIPPKSRRPAAAAAAAAVRGTSGEAAAENQEVLLLIVDRVGCTKHCNSNTATATVTHHQQQQQQRSRTRLPSAAAAAGRSKGWSCMLTTLGFLNHVLLPLLLFVLLLLVAAAGLVLPLTPPDGGVAALQQLTQQQQKQQQQQQQEKQGSSASHLAGSRSLGVSACAAEVVRGPPSRGFRGALKREAASHCCLGVLHRNRAACMRCPQMIGDFPRLSLLLSSAERGDPLDAGTLKQQEFKTEGAPAASNAARNAADRKQQQQQQQQQRQFGAACSAQRYLEGGRLHSFFAWGPQAHRELFLAAASVGSTPSSWRRLAAALSAAFEAHGVGDVDPQQKSAEKGNSSSSMQQRRTELLMLLLRLLQRTREQDSSWGRRLSALRDRLALWPLLEFLEELLLPCLLAGDPIESLQRQAERGISPEGDGLEALRASLLLAAARASASLSNSSSSSSSKSISSNSKVSAVAARLWSIQQARGALSANRSLPPPAFPGLLDLQRNTEGDKQEGPTSAEEGGGAPWLLMLAKGLKDTPGEASSYSDAPAANAPLLEGILKQGFSSSRRTAASAAGEDSIPAPAAAPKAVTASATVEAAIATAAAFYWTVSFLWGVAKSGAEAVAGRERLSLKTNQTEKRPPKRLVVVFVLGGIAVQELEAFGAFRGAPHESAGAPHESDFLVGSTMLTSPACLASQLFDDLITETHAV